jgi:hypothetical protein
MIDFKFELDAMRNNYAKSKQGIGSLHKPFWLTFDDTLSKLYEELPALETMGEIHYAAVVQANKLLFKFFPQFDCPANIIFNTDGDYNENPLELIKIAHSLYSYKNDDNAPEHIKKITDSITDEFERLYNIKWSDSNTFFTTIMVYRKHLPGRKLSGSILPVLTNPTSLQSTMVLPKKYWTRAFVDFCK